MYSTTTSFFPENSITNQQFYYFLPNTNQHNKTQLSIRIQSHKGINSFSLSKNTIIVIESASTLTNPNLLSLLQPYTTLFFYSNHHIEIINSKQSSSSSPSISIRLITVNDLLHFIDILSINNELPFHYKNGLPRTIDNNFLISIIFYKRRRKETKYHQFQIDTIPYYNREMPPNFSLFTSESEKIDIQQYINNTMNNKDEEINNTSSDNYYCQLCEIRFSKYIEHVESDKHLSKVKENKFLFKVIKERLRRLKRKEIKEGRMFYKEIIKKRKYCEYLLNKRIGV